MNYKDFTLGDWIGHISGVIEDESELDGNEMRDLVEFLSRLPKWIPVSERLPESLMVKTLVSCEDDNGLPISPMVALYDGYDKTWICAYKVIAWMPLPEPYKAERVDTE